MNNIYKLNTLPSPPDQRDIPFVPSVQPEDFAKSIDLMPNVYEVEDQLTIGSCVANGVSSQCEFLAKLNNEPVDLSRLFLYTATLDYEGRLGQEGLYVRDAYKVAYKYGICPEDGPEGYPYDVTKNTVRPPDEAYAVAQRTRVLRYEAVINGSTLNRLYEPSDKINRIKAALNEGLPVGFGMSVDSSILGLTGPWRNHTYRRIAFNENSVVAGGHYMVIIGYDDAAQRFLVLNSWGPQWGDGGFGGFPYSIVSEPFFEAWVIRNFDNKEVPEEPSIKFEGVNKFRLEARIIPEPHEVGKTVNLWIAAKAPDGSIYLRDEIPVSEIDTNRTHTDGSMDKWSPYVENVLPPTAKGYVLDEDNLIRVVQWRNLEGQEGTEVYLAYGTSPLDWKVSKLCTLPRL